MAEIKAIPTKYKGINFRSRLEARWAIFLDSMKLEWEYEKEGYQLSTGWYLPDFWLTEMKMWLEIKPEGVVCEHEMSLFMEHGSPVLASCGMPDRPMRLTCKSLEWRDEAVHTHIDTWTETLWAWYGNTVVVPKGTSYSEVFRGMKEDIKMPIEGDDGHISYVDYQQSAGGHIEYHESFIYSCQASRNHQFKY